MSSARCGEFRTKNEDEDKYYPEFTTVSRAKPQYYEHPGSANRSGPLGYTCNYNQNTDDSRQQCIYDALYYLYDRSLNRVRPRKFCALYSYHWVLYFSLFTSKADFSPRSRRRFHISYLTRAPHHPCSHPSRSGTRVRLALLSQNED